jgi:hypothetical protein
VAPHDDYAPQSRVAAHYMNDYRVMRVSDIIRFSTAIATADTGPIWTVAALNVLSGGPLSMGVEAEPAQPTRPVQSRRVSIELDHLWLKSFPV